MTFSDFVWFLLCEQDRRHERSVDYWARVCARPGAGGGLEVSREDMEALHSAVAREAYADPRDAPPFRDFLCEALDMVGPDAALPLPARVLRGRQLAPVVLGALTSPRVFILLEERREEAVRNGSTLPESRTCAVTQEWVRWSSAEYARYTAAEDVDAAAASSQLASADESGTTEFAAGTEEWRRLRSARRRRSWDALTMV